MGTFKFDTGICVYSSGERLPLKWCKLEVNIPEIPNSPDTGRGAYYVSGELIVPIGTNISADSGDVNIQGITDTSCTTIYNVLVSNITAHYEAFTENPVDSFLSIAFKSTDITFSELGYKPKVQEEDFNILEALW